ncbi:MAG TPA: hypothetical protein VFC44_25370 [Candidatus Saccharimonadales bacterium]|nr:hypothetical protein [Candidatus Saccharimonadales bacterium]
MKTPQLTPSKLNKRRILQIPSILAIVAGLAVTHSAMAQVGTGGANQLANPGWEIPAKAGWTAVGNTPEVTDTATYYNKGTCPADPTAATVVTHNGTNVANIYGNFTGAYTTSSWSQKLPVPPNSTWTGSGYAYCSHEDLMTGKNSFYYVVNFLDSNSVVLASYESYIITNLTCGETTPVPLDTWMLLAATNQMQVTSGTNTGAVIATVPTGVLTPPTNATTIQFQALFVQQTDNAGGSVYLDDANLGLVSGAAPPSITAATPNLVTLCTNTALTCTASSLAGVITNVQVTVQASALGGTVTTTTYGTNSSLLTVTGLGTTAANISFALTTNRVYKSVVVKATDNNNLSVSTSARFDTLTPALVIEASDFNFTTNGVSGGFIDTPTNGGLALYLNRVGTEGIDEHKTAGSGGQSNKDAHYRPTDPVIVGDAAPQAGPSSIEQKFVTSAAQGDTVDQEVEVGYNSQHDWLDYTRTYGPSGSAPAGLYDIWCYMATVGSGVQTAVYQVTSDPTQPNQTTNFIGNIGSASFSDNGWNNFVYVPLVDQFGNLVSINLAAGTQTLRSVVVNNPNLGFYMLVPATPVLTPALQYAYPDGLHPFEPTNKLSVTVGPANGASIAGSAVHLNVNGADVTSAATVTAAGNSWTVTYLLQLNAVYNTILNVTNTSGLSSSFTNNFDTFSISNYQWEADDYDFSPSQGGVGGLYIDNPVPTADVVQVNAQPTGTEETNSYFGYPGGSYGTGAQQGVDVNFGAAGQPNDPYRIDYVNVGGQPATDYLRPKFAAEQTALADPNIGPFNIGYFGAGYWLNYTRDWPTNNYNVWGRMAGGAGPFSGTTLSMVTNGAGTATQMTNVLGTFADPTASGWQAWHWVPLMSGGAMATVPLGGNATLKLTSGNNINVEFLMLTPAPSQPLLTASLTGGQLNLSIPTQVGYIYTVYYTTNLSAPNWQPVGGNITGDGTTHVVMESAAGAQGYYQVR